MRYSGLKNCRLFLIVIFFIPVVVMRSDTFIGTLRNTKGQPLKGIKVYVNDPKDAVKSDKKGEFRFNDLNQSDSIHIIYKKKEHGFAVKDRKDILLVVGEDGRIFDKDNYIGETFHGHLIDYKGKPIRGAVVYTNDPFDYVKSDIEGKFLIDNIVETDTIHIKYQGYIHDIAMDGSKGMYIKILRNTGHRVKRDLVNTGAGMMDARDYNGPRAVRTSEQIEALGATNIALAMQGMKGVNVRRKKDGSYEVLVRNGKPQWFLDGVRMDEMPDMPAIDVEKIEVLHDGGLIGIGGMGGVVNITTKGSSF